MSNFSIAISGLTAAQRAFELIGNNMANAATEGYHKQKIEFTPAYSSQTNGFMLGGGVEIGDVTRTVDSLLEAEINRQNSFLSQTEQECATLQTIENAFGEFLSGTGGLGTAIDDFFNALNDLSAYPAEPTWQNQATSSAEMLANQFRTIGTFLSNLDEQLKLEIDVAVDSVNLLSTQTAEFNESIQKIEISGQSANNLSDSRDQCLSELSELMGLQTQQGEYGSVSASFGGLPIVLDASSSAIKTGYDANGKFGLAMVGSDQYTTSFQGGKIAGLLNLKNEILPQIISELDSLANSIINQVNDIHVQGCGSAGSFSELVGVSMESGVLENISSNIVDGQFNIRLTNTDTGEITRHAINVDVSVDTMETIAAKISAISGLDAAIINSQLSVQAQSGYEFDFMPSPLPQPELVDFNGTTDPTVLVSGIYDGSANDTFTFTVSGSGEVSNGSLQLNVTNSAGQTIGNLNIGSGYAAGDTLDLGNGLSITVSSGNLADGDSFTVKGFADTDTSGFLSAARMNTLFTGTSATDIQLNADIVSNPARIATACGSDFADNTNVAKMIALSDSQLTVLNDLSFSQFYNKMVTDIGQDISTRSIQQENSELMVQNLTNQQTQISGVDINQEAAELLIYEQMYQAMAKYLSTTQESLTTLMGLIQ